jgi:hypothetical protein
MNTLTRRLAQAAAAASALALIRQLEAGNQQLRDALARTLGERRAADILGETGRRDTPNATRRNSSDPAEQTSAQAVNDTVHIASQQVTAMIKTRAQDNGR